LHNIFSSDLKFYLKDTYLKRNFQLSIVNIKAKVLEAVAELVGHVLSKTFNDKTLPMVLNLRQSLNIKFVG